MTDHDPQEIFTMPSSSDESITITSSISMPSPTLSSSLDLSSSSTIPDHGQPTNGTRHGHDSDGAIMYKAYVMPYSWYWIISVFLLMVTLHLYRITKHHYRKRKALNRNQNDQSVSYKSLNTTDRDDQDDDDEQIQLLHSQSHSRPHLRSQSYHQSQPQSRSQSRSRFSPQSQSSTIIDHDQVRSYWIRRLITGLSATFRNIMYLRSFPWWLYGPETLMDASFTILYVTVYLYLCFHLTDSWWPLHNDNIANRMGILSFSQLPIILLLVSKNNPISSLTGITYQKLNYLHRASSRVCLMTSWVHAILWTPRVWAVKDFRQYLLCGIAALFGFTMLWVTSFRFVRRVAYEFFLASHIIFTVMYLVGAYFHWYYLGQWVLPALAIWIFDRLLRFLKVLYQNNFHNPRKWKSRGESKIELLDHDVMRVTIRRDNFHWKAGQHAFISAPSISGMPHESHPFSIANVPTESANDTIFLIRVHTGFTKKLRTALSSDLTTSVPLYIEGPYGYAHSLDSYSTVLLLAGGTGVTFVSGHFLQILQNVKKGKSAVKKLHLVWHIRHVEDIEWIAPLLNEGIKELYSKDNADSNSNESSSINVDHDIDIEIDIFVTKSHSSDEPWPTELNLHDTIQEVTPRILNEVTPRILNEVTPRIMALRGREADRSWDEGCMTCSIPGTPINESRDETYFSPKRQTLLGRYGLLAETAEKIRWRKGRAKLNEIVKYDAENCIGTMNVSVCGPVQLLKAAKSAVRETSNLKSCMDGLSSIDFFEETLGA
ncbi:uncharacterized protein IL334_004567 [Kwoniella shivajii]|uniref:ferric-chelate reductase (NADPH) n=1 Tax=Kwoniella shivajii TaxID=564305 RepID=A0ABZ1D2F7_9TREE|nr:hypothetical protein IL334_004567 [Kwoniella shivajii]